MEEVDKRGKNVPDELAREPEEGLLKVVVGLGRDLKVLEVLLAVEGDGSSLDFPLLRGLRRRVSWRSRAGGELIGRDRRRRWARARRGRRAASTG